MNMQKVLDDIFEKEPLDAAQGQIYTTLPLGIGGAIHKQTPDQREMGVLKITSVGKSEAGMLATLENFVRIEDVAVVQIFRESMIQPASVMAEGRA